MYDDVIDISISVQSSIVWAVVVALDLVSEYGGFMFSASVDMETVWKMVSHVV